MNFYLALIAKLCYDINAGGFGELRQTKYCQQICLVWTMPQHLKHKAFYYRKEKRWSILALTVSANLIALRFATQKLTINEH